MNDTFAQQFKLSVFLDIPPRPLGTLLRLRGARPHIFALRCPLILRLFPVAPVHIMATHRWNEILLLELLDFSERHPDKLLTLIPCSAEAARFVQAYRADLEQCYTVQTEV